MNVLDRYINGFALHGVKPGEYIDDPSRILFIQKAVDSAKLILRTQLESTKFRRALRYAVVSMKSSSLQCIATNIIQDYLGTSIDLAVNFLLKAVTAVHCHLDIHGINRILGQVIKMFDEAEIPDSAKYVRGISETISEITHTTLSPRDQPPDIEDHGVLFDVNNLVENPVR